MAKLLRWLVPALLVLVWLVVGGMGGPYFGKLEEVQSRAATDFLPRTAESTRVSAIQTALADADGFPAIVVYESAGAVGPEAIAALVAQTAAIRAVPGVAEVSPPIPSAQRDAAGNIRAAEVFVLVDVVDFAGTVMAIREIVAETPEGIVAYVTGPAGFAADLTEAFAGIDGVLLLVAVAAVLLILLVVYRSPILPIVVLLSSISALAASVVGVYLMAEAEWIVLNAQAQGILFILVVGAATDYGLLLVSRYRDTLREEPNAIRALLRALRGVIAPVVASASTVVAGLLCLLISDLASNKALGPVAAVGIVFAVLASLTFLPAMLALIGRPAFWPAIPRPEARVEGTALSHGIWTRIAGLVSRRARVLWIASVVVLAVAAAFAPRLNATGIPQDQLLLGEAESVTGQAVLERYFPAGSGAPTVVIAPAADAEAVLAALRADEAVAEAQINGTPTMVNGEEIIELTATLRYGPDSDEALAAVERLRPALRAVSPGVLVGGSSAISLDTLDNAERDLRTIVPLILAVITLILIVLLRSVLAPILLLATTVLSYFAALGVSGLVFQYAFGFPGADPAVPLFAFVFLVALGIDYNIFLTTRIREEAILHGTRPGILRGLEATGGVITSAGIVLAATFAALAVIPVIFLVQIAFIVSVGVLIDAILVRSILVPGLLYDIGRPIWWPGRRIR
ncbi:MAG: MMPL family transporter [Bauldia sp.]|nr:MMPL family transporter [Bauldia sp.]